MGSVDGLADKLQRLTDELKSEADRQKQSIEENKALAKEIQEFRQSNETLVRKLKDQEKQGEQLKDDKRQLEMKITQLEAELDELRQREETRARSVEAEGSRMEENGELTERLQAAEKERQALQDELEQTKTRLSKEMSDKLTDNNPNITDLSDLHRPTKLAERYSELYDNLWTDAFEILDRGDEEKTIKSLFHILQETFRYCKSATERQLKEILDAMTQKTGALNKDVSRDKLKLYQNCRKAVAETAVDNAYQVFVRDIENNVSSVTSYDALKVRTYLKECFKICWFMCVQDVPVVFDNTPRYYDSFDDTKYRTYTSKGPRVAFVVWPAMLLHEDGPVLCKGVAQGYDPAQPLFIPRKEASGESTLGRGKYDDYTTSRPSTWRSSAFGRYGSLDRGRRDLYNIRPRTNRTQLITDADTNDFLYYREKYWDNLEMARIMVGPVKYDRCVEQLLNGY